MTRPHHQLSGWHAGGLLVQQGSDNPGRVTAPRRKKDPRGTAGQALRPFAVAAVASVMMWMMLLTVLGVI